MIPASTQPENDPGYEGQQDRPVASQIAYSQFAESQIADI